MAAPVVPDGRFCREVLPWRSDERRGEEQAAGCSGDNHRQHDAHDLAHGEPPVVLRLRVCFAFAT